MSHRSLFAALLISTAVPALAWNSEPQSVSFQNSEGRNIPAKLFTPASWVPGSNQRFPAVVMLHGCSGIYSNSLPNAQFSNIQSLFREWADRLTAAGYVALLVDSFTPRKPAGQNQSECNNGAGVGISEVTERPLDAMAAHQYLQGLTDRVRTDRIGVLGWSHGASTVLATLADTLPDGVTPKPEAAARPFRGGVAFYPGCGLNSAYNGITFSKWRPYGAVSILHGSADPLYYDASKNTFALQYKCTTRQDRAIQFGAGDGNGNPVTLTVYTGAAHSFDMAGGTCVSTVSTPDACAKQQGDAAAMATLNQLLQ
ncbi:dienelactone hydrolase family protein [Parachitinimonas caeni]|uniref:Dienelactone hydrolase domain-containing protein n=1 Tax=Parachitinimonas caeni TaxID=3031301 RepID=A0ABT7E1E9_9NEIS|nr:hypothetical protein [Parachitinimonas caeni]MDK2124737.1 hypothetical protein [Parachitinimonas caeni]